LDDLLHQVTVVSAAALLESSQRIELTVAPRDLPFTLTRRTTLLIDLFDSAAA